MVVVVVAVLVDSMPMEVVVVDSMLMEVVVVDNMLMVEVVVVGVDNMRMVVVVVEVVPDSRLDDSGHSLVRLVQHCDSRRDGVEVVVAVAEDRMAMVENSHIFNWSDFN